MVKILKLGNQVMITLNSGDTITKKVSNTVYEALKKCKTDTEVLSLISDDFKTKYKNIKIVEEINESSIITYDNECAYWYDVSNLSLPKDLAEQIIQAEKNKDEILLETLKNFWTLLCLNTDELCRNKLYTFLTKHDLKIERSGFFITYRNVSKINSNDAITKDTIFTDDHSRTFRIKIGEMVTMPRNKCDSDSNVTCSRGF